jgi:hypothetical protein
MVSFARGSATIALGVWLASRNALVRLSLVLAALVAVLSVGIAIATKGRFAAQLPTMVSLGTAWSLGVTLAFGGGLRAIAQDEEDGVLALVRMRAVPEAHYARGRVAGLILLLALSVGGATLVAALAATAVATERLAVGRESVAALAYALAFATVIGPVAFAAVATGTRAGGYLILVAILALPELAAPWTAGLLPQGWHELTSIPAALDAVRAGVVSPSTAGLPLLRAIAGLTAVVAASLAVVQARVRHVQPKAGA